MKKILLIVFILTLNIVSAFDQECYYGIPCTISDHLYNNSYDAINANVCHLTIKNNANQIVLNDVNMTNSSDGLHNYTITYYNFGYYPAFMNCSYQNTKIYIDKSFNVVNNSQVLLNTTGIFSSEEDTMEITIAVLLVALFFILLFFANSINTDASNIMPLIKTVLYGAAVLVIWGVVQTLYELSILSGLNLSIPYMLYWAASGIGLLIIGLVILTILVNSFIYVQKTIKKADSGRNR